MISRRQLVRAGLGAIVVPLTTQAQPTPAHIGFLSAAPLSSITARIEAFRQGLASLGYVEGRNIVIEWRSADDTWSRLDALAAELVRLNVALIVTAEGPAALAAARATRTIPIVMGQSGDPVAMGVAASLAHPGGNVSGLTTLSSELPAKQVGLLRETVPKLSRLAILTNPDNPLGPVALKHAEAAALALGLHVQSVNVREAKLLDNAFVAMGKARADALLVLPDPMLLTQRKQLADLAQGNKLPAMYGIPEYAQAGGLMVYAASRSDLFRRAAIYVDRILRGAKPAELPIEQPTKFELVINLGTARVLGLTIPQSVLLRADEIIQ